MNTLLLLALFTFPAGEEMPLSFSIKGDLVENEENTLKIKQTFYAKLEGEDFLLSTDLVEWKPFQEFLTGSISTSFSVEEDADPAFFIGIEANRR